MDAPVKERLTGALILVALLVIVVPEMLSGPKRRAADAPPAQPAAAGPPMRTYSLELGPNTVQRGAEQATLVPQAVSEAATAPTSTPAPRVEREPVVAAPVVTAPVVAAQAQPAPVASPAVTPPTEQAAGRWWAQLGSFAARDNAERLAQKLRAAGFQMDVSAVRTAGKELHRVRAGPVRDRDAAVALQARLAAVGHKASLVAP